MAEINLTSEQRTAIEKEGSLLVGAAAGSGKTFVLTERIARILGDRDHPVSASRLAVLTFSNAAASEMRQKIKKKLGEMTSADPSDSYLRQQQRMLRRTHIGTVHSFCQKLLREFFSEAGISPDFGLCDENYSSALRMRAMEQAMDILAEEDPDTASVLFGSFGRSRSDREAMNAVSALHDFEQNLIDPIGWEDEVLANAEKEVPFSESPACEASLERLASEFSQALSLCDGALELLRLEDGGSAACSYFSDYTDRIRAASRSIEKKDIAAAKGIVSEKVSGKLTFSRSADEEMKNRVKAVRDVCDKLYKRAGKMLEEETEENTGIRHSMSLTVKALIEGERRFRRQLDLMKKERNLLEYDDLEILTLRLFYGSDGKLTDTAREVASRYDHVLVDEFQDTNERQKLIFDALSHSGKHLFCVGDVKQSIYSFRRADPTIFTSMAEKSVAPGGPEYIGLHSNFRSDERVIEAVNRIFDPLMTTGFGGADYRKTERLVHGKTDDTDNGTECGVEYHCVDCGSDELPEAVAGYIAGLLNSGYKVPDGDGTRPVREEDIVILLRSVKGRTGDYVSALEKAGIRCSSGQSEDFFDSSEIMTLMSLLRAVSNPGRDVDLAAVMLSPLCGYTLDEFAALRLRDRSARLWTAVRNADDSKSIYLRELINGLREKASSMSAEELVREAIEDSEAEILLTAQPDTAKRKARLRALIDYAAGYTAFGGRGLTDFIRYCDDAAEKQRGPQVTEGAASGVLITTVHKSKGLEWPVVILADASKQFNTQPISASNVLFDQKAGIGLKVRVETENGLWNSRTPEFGTIEQIKISSQKEEELRILYVALTRARQRAAVFASRKEKKNGGNADDAILDGTVSSLNRDGTLSPMLVEEKNCFADWIAQAFSAAGFTSSDTGKEVTVREPLMLVRKTPETYAFRNPGPEDMLRSADASLTEEINSRLGFMYGYGGVVQIPTSLTVTQLTESFRPALAHRPAFVRKDGLTAAERGIAMHEFMQHCDPAAAAEDPAAEAQRLMQQQFLSEEAAASIEPEAVRDFFRGRLGKEILEADRVYREYSYIDSVRAIEVIPDVDITHENDLIIIQGTVDCIIEKGGKLTVLDYKTDRATRPEDLLERYSQQLRTYSRSVSKRFGLPVEKAVIWSFALSQEIEVDMSVKDVE